MDGTRGKLPSFRSDREERDLWNRHSVEEFADELEQIDVKIRQRVPNRLHCGFTRMTLRP